jgi:hypothetical protein
MKKQSKGMDEYEEKDEVEDDDSGDETDMIGAVVSDEEEDDLQSMS